MPVLGKLLSVIQGFIMTASALTTYSHSLGFTPTFVSVIPVGTAVAVAYTAADMTNIFIISAGTSGHAVDITCGSFHSIIK